MTTRCRGRRAGHCGPVEVRLRPTMPRGTSMEQYLVLGRIGEGAHGVVFKAKHRETGELVALKKVPLRRPEDGVPPQTLREIKALREMEPHPHVIRLRAAFAQGPAVVLALELLVGDLGGLLRAAPAPLPPARVRALLAMTLRGLAHVHGQRLLHRDLKPANLLLDSAGHLKLADFGLARVLGPTPGRPYSHQVATRWYRAPELLYGARHYDEGVDLWSCPSCRISPSCGSARGRRGRCSCWCRAPTRPRWTCCSGCCATARACGHGHTRFQVRLRPWARQALLHPFFFGPQELTPPPPAGGPRQPPDFSLDTALELPPRGALGPLPNLGDPH
ncbi:cyclin-dependent kinase 20-like isoform X7 [Vidua chalybeata]|uniref:cyclin-dependent kinase 20-like isoform X7 n=1 Tax=Vidua chalybeata TaxID=81927 RepID=UPI0023A7F844|nr:cyclin-dependent kinase 20-like isoform X7 [Vidua chalybeata]